MARRQLNVRIPELIEDLLELQEFEQRRFSQIDSFVLELGFGSIEGIIDQVEALESLQEYMRLSEQERARQPHPFGITGITDADNLEHFTELELSINQDVNRIENIISYIFRQEDIMRDRITRRRENNENRMLLEPHEGLPHTAEGLLALRNLHRLGAFRSADFMEDRRRERNLHLESNDDELASEN